MCNNLSQHFHSLVFMNIAFIIILNFGVVHIIQKTQNQRHRSLKSYICIIKKNVCMPFYCDTKRHTGMCDLSLILPHLRSPPAAGTQSVALLLLLGSYSSSDFIFCQNQNMQDPQVLLVLKKMFYFESDLL